MSACSLITSEPASAPDSFSRRGRFHAPVRRHGRSPPDPPPTKSSISVSGMPKKPPILGRIRGFFRAGKGRKTRETRVCWPSDPNSGDSGQEKVGVRFPL